MNPGNCVFSVILYRPTVSDVDLGLVPWPLVVQSLVMSLALRLESLVLALALRLKSLVLALALRVKSLLTSLYTVSRKRNG